jgi:type I restriction enzyme M protein
MVFTKDKLQHGRDRKNETLFIDARNLGTMETRVLKFLLMKIFKKFKIQFLLGELEKDMKTLKVIAKVQQLRKLKKMVLF